MGDDLVHDLVADDVVLVELSKAFAEETSESEVAPTPQPEPQRPIDPGLVVSAAAEPGLAGGDDDGDQHDVADEAPAADAGPNIITIGALDDLPDVAYLDEELERDSSGSAPVFIDDDGSSDAVLPQEANARGIEPRIRQRRIGVKRAESRRRLWWIALGGAVLVVVIGLLAVLGSSLFDVKDITLTGDVNTDPDALAEILDDLEGTPVLRVDTTAYEDRLESLPWVDRARVRTDFPNAASVEIVERTPVAAMLGADGMSRVIDDEGRVLTLVEGEPVALVWFAGVGTLDAAPGQVAPVGYASAASLVPKLTPSIRSRVQYLLVTPDGGDLVMVLSSDRGPIEVRFGSAIGGAEQIEKLVRLERTLDDSADRPVAVVDVSTSEVTVR